MQEWEVRVTDEWLDWFKSLDELSRALVTAAIDVLSEEGPNLGRPLVDRIEGSNEHNLNELRPASAGRSEIRILFVFDPWRSAVLLLGGDKSGRWSRWYATAIPEAERLYAEYLEERRLEEEEERKGHGHS